MQVVTSVFSNPDVSCWDIVRPWHHDAFALRW